MNAPLRYTLDVTTTRGMVHVGDCLAWLRSLPDESVDAVVTDPPYGLGKEPDPRGDTGSAARFFYCAKATRREREAGLDHLPRDGARANIHPTVKPLALMRWLVRLVTPPGGLVIDPYTGSGTTGVAAVCEGMRFAGAELDTWHGVLAHERIAYAMGHGPSGFEDVAEGDEDDDTGADVVPMQAVLPLGG